MSEASDVKDVRRIIGLDNAEDSEQFLGEVVAQMAVPIFLDMPRGHRSHKKAVEEALKLLAEATIQTGLDLSGFGKVLLDRLEKENASSSVGASEVGSNV